MQDYNQAYAHVAALTQCAPESCIVDLRMIHDVRKDIPAIPMRGLLPELWSNVLAWQSQGYGAFINISHMGDMVDGNGRITYVSENVLGIRCNVIDLDDLSAEQNYHRAVAHTVAPQFAVNSSKGKYHVYWQTPYHIDADSFTLRQRKLAQWFQGDKRIIDPARVLRLAGTLHLKEPSQPHLVQCWALGGFGSITTTETLDASLAHINVIDAGSGGRHDLGDPTLQAPSLEWLQRVLDLTDPNTLDRGDWLSLSAAVKQSGWNLTDEVTLLNMWQNWSARYSENNPAENMKLWNSIRNTEVGWPSLARKVPQINLERYAPSAPVQIPTATAGVAAAPPPVTTTPPSPPPLDCSGEYLTWLEQQEYFKGCSFVTNLGQILTPNMRFLNQVKFNGMYNGKKFIIDSEGKTTKSAWEAATGGTEYRIPKVDHIRFLPSLPHGEVIIDEMGREGVNIYKPAKIASKEGDPTIFLRHIAFLLPDVNDQKILLDYLAHCIKYPGFKIPWAPVIQSAEGAGKDAIQRIMNHCIGNVYTYPPKASELAESGAKFNAWLRAKLFILVDEIKVDDRRDMIEVLKPLISQEVGEVQAKGVDQDKEDNYANWMFFTNYKDAVPINQNSRRFCIFYSAFQSAKQIESWLGADYFTELYDWVKGDGGPIMYNYFMNHYPLERGKIPMRAPNTSSTPEVLKKSMGAVERMISESIEDDLPGFRGGWISSRAVRKRLTETGMRALSVETIEKIISEMGYTDIGRSPRPYIEEGDAKSRTTLFNLNGDANVNDYAAMQGYF